ncbi:Asp23/Gls24 family envelope stress response protein [Streptomyces sp. NPDC001089]
MALDDHPAPSQAIGRHSELSEASPAGENRPHDEAADAVDPAMDTATWLLRNRNPLSTQRLIEGVTTLVREEARLRPWLLLDDRTDTLRITERAASVALRHAADAVPGVTAASCRLARAEQSAGMHVSMTLSAGLDRPLPETAGLVRRSVADASGRALGIAVTSVDITVIDAHGTGA